MPGVGAGANPLDSLDAVAVDDVYPAFLGIGYVVGYVLKASDQQVCSSEKRCTQLYPQKVSHVRRVLPAIPMCSLVIRVVFRGYRWVQALHPRRDRHAAYLSCGYKGLRRGYRMNSLRINDAHLGLNERSSAEDALCEASAAFSRLRGLLGRSWFLVTQPRLHDGETPSRHHSVWQCLATGFSSPTCSASIYSQ